MWIMPRLLHLICKSRYSKGGNVQWVCLRGVPRLDMEVLNVYALHTPQDRAILWEELLLMLLRDCRWFFADDWNFVEGNKDKSDFKEPMRSEQEIRLFKEFKINL